MDGNGVEQDEKKAVQYFKKAAMQGHVKCRHQLGFIELHGGSHERAVRHFLISAKMGFKYSLDNIKTMFMDGNATKEQYAQALRGYQDAVEGTKSHDRDEAMSFMKNQRLAK